MASPMNVFFESSMEEWWVGWQELSRYWPVGEIAQPDIQWQTFARAV